MPQIDYAEIERRKHETPQQSAKRLSDELAAWRKQTNEQNARIYKSPLDQANYMANDGATPQPKRTLRDIDDGQSYALPDLTPQEFVEGLKNDKEGKLKKQYWGVDTALRDTVGDAIMGELGISPSDFHKLVDANSNEDYIKAYDEWDKGGRKPNPKSSWDFNRIYDKDAYLKLYRPQEQWGRADHIRTKDEWGSKFDPKGIIHDEFNPYKVGYQNSRAAWDKFINDYGEDVINPSYKKIIEWLDTNKEYF